MEREGKQSNTSGAGDLLVQFDEKGYRLAGQPVWLASGEFHYFKTTRGDWRRRLLQQKLAGLNTVSVYMPWNFHEVEEGQWDFQGDKDVAYFLELAAELGLYVVARPGPFICNEWQAGGIPPWLSRKPGIRLRTADKLYLSYCDRWWDKIAPIIARYQLGREGTIILVQVENEYGHMGQYQEEDYIYHLRDGLRQRGVTVPLINCDSFIRFERLQPRKWEGINLCCNFGGDGIRNLARARELQPAAPLFVTEYWIAAFDWWGRDGSAVVEDRRALFGALEIAAGGAAGLTLFVFSGGAHFAYWHGQSICSDANFMTTLYGPGAPILDDGSFSPKYNLFKTQITGLMAGGSELAQAGMPELTEVGKGLLKAVRRGPQAEFTFYLNQSEEQIRLADQEKEQAAVDFAIPAGAVNWTVRHLLLPGGFVLQETNAGLFAADPALVLYGQPGQKIRLILTSPSAGEKGVGPALTWRGEGFQATMDGANLCLEATVPEGDWVLQGMATAGATQLSVLLLSEEAVTRCWRVNLPGAPVALVGGPERIEEAKVEEGQLRLRVTTTAPHPCWQVTAAAGYQERRLAYRGETQPWRESLQKIQISKDFPEAQPDYVDQDWVAAPQPLPMAHFGHGQGRAWYRAKFYVQDAGPQILYLSGAADRALFFVDGEFHTARGTRSHCGWHVMASLEPGEHTIAILVENLGMFNTGAEMDIPLGEPKGLFGPVWLNGVELQGWRMRAGLRAGEKLEFWPQMAEGLPWREMGTDGADRGETIKGPVYLRGEFSRPVDFDGAVRLLLPPAGAGKGSVWLNGHNLGRYWEVGPQHSLWLPLSWLEEMNELILFEELAVTPAQIQVEFRPFGRSAEWLIM